MRIYTKSQQQSLIFPSLVVPMVVRMRARHKCTSALRRFKTWSRRLHRLNGRCVIGRSSRRRNRGKLEAESCGLG